MAYYKRNSGKSWAPPEIKAIRVMAQQNTPTRVIGLKLGRSPEAVYQKASEKGISLAPTNQSPYGTKK